MSFYDTAWVIFVYSFLGWCAEVVFAACRRGIFVNRGFLNGPVCPIYGFGVALVLALLAPVKDSFILLFLGSMVVTTVLEFIIGFIMESFFHDKWWDYSQNPFNIKGYVCLEFSLIWGFACVLVVDVIHPLVARLVALIPNRVGWWLIWGFAVIMAADALITLIELLKLPKRFKAVEELERMMTAVSDAVGKRCFTRGMTACVRRMRALMSVTPSFMRRIWRRSPPYSISAVRSIPPSVSGRMPDLPALPSWRARYPIPCVIM